MEMLGEMSGLGTDGAITRDVLLIISACTLEIYGFPPRAKKKKTKERYLNDSAFIYLFLTLYLLCFVSVATKSCLKNTQLYSIIPVKISSACYVVTTSKAAILFHGYDIIL